MNRLQRIERMEKSLDAAQAAIRGLDEALTAYEDAQGEIRRLFRYYESPQWMRDFEADEAGRLPEGLKRGVLSEDAIYNLILENRELGIRMLRLVAEGMDSQIMG